jgi:hypothetical protein
MLNISNFSLKNSTFTIGTYAATPYVVAAVRYVRAKHLKTVLILLTAALIFQVRPLAEETASKSGSDIMSLSKGSASVF